MHGVWHDLQCPGSAGAFSSFVLLQLNPRFVNNGLRKFNTRAHQTCVNEEERGRERLHATPANHEVVAGHPHGNRDSLA